MKTLTAFAFAAVTLLPSIAGARPTLEPLWPKQGAIVSTSPSVGWEIRGGARPLHVRVLVEDTAGGEGRSQLLSGTVGVLELPWVKRGHKYRWEVRAWFAGHRSIAMPMRSFTVAETAEEAERHRDANTRAEGEGLRVVTHGGATAAGRLAGRDSVGLVGRLAGRAASSVAASSGTGAEAPAEVATPIDTRNLDGLNPAFRKKVETILRRLQAKGWKPRVAEGLRTLAQQREKVRLGFSKTLRSRHLLGLGADIIDSRYGWSGPAAKTSFAFWKDLGEEVRAVGLTWGGNFRTFKDVAHVQD